LISVLEPELHGLIFSIASIDLGYPAVNMEGTGRPLFRKNSMSPEKPVDYREKRKPCQTIIALSVNFDDRERSPVFPFPGDCVVIPD
jgi:hypothetical protein